ncbi:MAG: hypothetical protein V4542_00890 [Pseudomonadota bacterium]
MRAKTYLMSGALLLCGAAHSFDFKGLVLGDLATTDAVESALAYCGPTSDRKCEPYQLRMNVKCGAGENNWQICNGITTVAGNAARVNLVINGEGVIQRIALSDISSRAFGDISEQLKTKFGKPRTQKQSAVQNGFGAVFEQTELVWSNAKRHRVEFIEYDGSIDNSSLYFGIPQDRQQIARPRKKGDL